MRALFKFDRNIPKDAIVIDTTSGSGRYVSLSPFVLDARKYMARRFENLWQFSKVYPDQIDADGEPSTSWFEWRHRGFTSDHAVRYPKGKGAIPLYSFWNGSRLGYIDARKQIYAPVYAELVQSTLGFSQLKEQLEWATAYNRELILLDYDAYDHTKLGMSLVDVINNPDRKMGHAFVLLMILTGVLDECLKGTRK